MNGRTVAEKKDPGRVPSLGSRVFAIHSKASVSSFLVRSQPLRPDGGKTLSLETVSGKISSLAHRELAVFPKAVVD